MNDRKTVISVSIEPNQYEFIKQQQEYYKLPMAKIVRMALNRYMEESFRTKCERINTRYR